MNNKNLAFLTVLIIFFALTWAIFSKRPKVNPLEPQIGPFQTNLDSNLKPEFENENSISLNALKPIERKTANFDNANSIERNPDFNQIANHKKKEIQKNSLNKKPNYLVAHPLFLQSSWKVWPQVTAKPIRSNYHLDGEVVGQLNGYNLIQTSTESTLVHQFNLKNPLVLFDERLQRPGILTGLLIASAGNRHELESCAHSHSASIKNSFENINTYILISDVSPFDLSTLKNQIAACPSVKSVRLEIIDRPYEKK